MAFGFLAVAMASFPGSNTQAQQTFVDICDRTPQVETAILRTLGLAADGIACADVPITGLNGITTLDLAGMGVRALKVDDFDGLDSLETLDLSNNDDLTALPPGVLDSVLDTLTTLNLDSRLQGEVFFVESGSNIVAGTTATVSVMRTQPYTTVTVSVGVSGEGAGLFTVPAVVTIPGGTTQTAINVSAAVSAINRVVTLTLGSPALVPPNAAVASSVVRVADPPANTHTLTASSPTATLKAFTAEFGGTEAVGDPVGGPIPIAEGDVLFTRFMLSRPLAGNEKLLQIWRVLPGGNINATFTDLRFASGGDDTSFGRRTTTSSVPTQTERLEVRTLDDGIVEGPERFRIGVFVSFASDVSEAVSPLHVTPPGEITGFSFLSFEIRDNDTAVATVAVAGTVREGGAMPTAAVALSGPLAVDAVFTLELQAGADNPATVNGAGADVTFAANLSTAAVTVSAGDTTSTAVVINVVNDNAVDGGEKFKVGIIGIEVADESSGDNPPLRRDLDNLITRVAGRDVAISDDDSTARLSATAAANPGEGGNLAVTLTLDRNVPPGNTVISYRVVVDADSAAPVESADFDPSTIRTTTDGANGPSNAVIVRADGGDTLTFTINVADDNRIEFTEQGVVSIASIRYADGSILTDAANSTASFAITDNDGLRVSLTDAGFNISDNAGMLNVVVNAVANPSPGEPVHSGVVLDRAVTATLTSSDGSAIAGMDYTTVAETFTYAAGVAPASRNVNVAIIDDADTRTETFTLTLDTADTAVTSTTARATIIIVPDSVPSVDVCRRTPQVETAILGMLGLDDDGIVCAYVPITGLNGITTLDLAGMGVRALKVDDFDGLDSLETLDLSNNDDLTVLPPGVLDSVLDTLTTLNLDSRLQGEISFVESGSNIVAGTTATVSVMRTQPYTTVTVSVGVSGEGAGLFTVPAVVTIPGGTTQTAINVSAAVSAINRVVTLTLGSPALVPLNAAVASSVVRVADPPANTHTLTASSPTATLKAFTTEFGGTEAVGDPVAIPIAEGDVLFTRFMLSKPLAGNETLPQIWQVFLPDGNINATFTDLRFVSGGDDTSFGMRITTSMAPAQTERLEVRALDDGIVEGPERFQIGVFVSFSSDVSGAVSPLHVTPPGEITGFSFLSFEIRDNDTAAATAVVTGTAREGGAMPTAAVALSGPLAVDAVFTLELQAGADNPATVNGAGADVTFAANLSTAAVTVSAGDTTSTAVIINVVNDDAVDGGEKFKVGIIGIEAADESSGDNPPLRRDLDSLITRIAGGDVAISDDPAARLSATAAANPGEGGDLAVTLTLDENAPPGNTVISYRVVVDADSEDPVESADFDPSTIRTTTDGANGPSNAVTVRADGGDTLTFTINVADDNRIEFTEQGVVSIASIRYADGSILADAANSTASFAITDNDGLRVSLTDAGFNISDNAGMLNVVVNAVANPSPGEPVHSGVVLDRAVTATLTSSDGSAIAGMDYTAVAETFTYAAGVAPASRNVNVAITDDADTRTETFTLTLDTADTAVTSTTARATITIVPGPVSIVNVCDRTPQVEIAILTAASTPGSFFACTSVPADALGGITTLNLAGRRVTALKVDDFDGLDSLETLDLSNNDDLTALPPGVLDPVLDTLTTLNLDSRLRGEVSFVESDSSIVAGTTATVSVMRTQPYTAVTVSAGVSGEGAGLFTVPAVTIPAGTTQTAINVSAAVSAINRVVTLTLGSPALVPLNAAVASSVVRVADPPANTHTLTASSPTATLKAFTAEFGGTEAVGDPVGDPIPIAEGDVLFTRFMLSRPLAGNEKLLQTWRVLPGGNINATFTDLRFASGGDDTSFGRRTTTSSVPTQTERLEVRTLDDGIVEGPERFRIGFFVSFVSDVSRVVSPLHVTPPGEITGFSFLSFEIRDNDIAAATVAVAGTAREGGVMPTAAVALSGPLAVDAVFTLELQAGADNPATVNGAGADVTFAANLSTAAVTVSAGDTTSTAVIINVVNDDAVDGGEKFKVGIIGIEAADESSGDNPPLRRDLDSLITRVAGGDVVISDGSVARLFATAATARERDNQAGIVTFVLDNAPIGASAAVNFTLSTATGVAMPGEDADYTLAITHSSGVVVTPDPLPAAGGSFRLPDGVTGAVFTVTPVADAVADDGETVVIRVTGVDFSAGLDITVPTAERTVTIADYGTLPVVNLAGADATLSEGETHVSTLTFTNAPSRFAATVFLHMDGSGEGVSTADYTVTAAYADFGGAMRADIVELTASGTADDPYGFVLPAGVGEAALRVFLNEDSLAEARETLRLTLLRVEFADLGDGTDSQFAPSARIGITINRSFDMLIAVLAVAGEPAEENLTTGTFTLQLSNAPTVSTASFNYAFTGGILNENFDAAWRINNGVDTDISSPAGPLAVPGSAFTGREADVVFTIKPLADDDNAVSEIVTLTISNLMYGTTAVTSIANNPAQLRITDDDGIRLRIRAFLEGALQ